MTDGPAAVDRPPLLPLEELLWNAEECALQSQIAASMTDPVSTGDGGVSGPVAARLTYTAAATAESWAASSQAWSALAVARMRAGAKLDEEPKDPRAALRRRASGRPAA